MCYIMICYICCSIVFILVRAPRLSWEADLRQTLKAIDI